MTEEKKGVSAWLRGIVDESYGKESRPLCTGIADTFFGIECREMPTCGSCILAMLTAIADRIDAERALPDGVEWPRFEDGELVRVGDEVEFEGETMRVYLATFDADGWALWCSREGIDGKLSGSFGERVKRPTPKVLDADGVPIEVGDTVYLRSNGREGKVVGFYEDKGETWVGETWVSVSYELGSDRMTVNTDGKALTHERPDSWERIEEDAKLAPRDYLEKRGMNPEKTERIASMMADLVRRAKALAKAGEVE